jgi:hypothetical protein
MEQSPSSEANSHSASQEIPRLFWNPEVHYLSLSRAKSIQFTPFHTISKDTL